MTGGPYFDDLTVGQVFDWAPSMTLTAGAAAVHQSILGDRMRLPLDAELSHAVTGAAAALAHPALVCDVAIGQSTLATQRVKANLFYRGLTFYRFPVIGDTLYTRTEVVGLQAELGQTGPRADGAGGAADDDHRPGRPAGAGLLPLRDAAAERRTPTETGHADDLSAIGADLAAPAPTRPPTGTATRSAAGCPARTSTPGWRARCCTAPPTWSAARRNWPG